MEESVKIISSDNKEYIVNKNIIKKSILIKNIIDGKKDNEIKNVNVNVDGKLLQKIIEWCKYHRDEDDHITKINKIDIWDSNFYGKDQDTIFEIINAAYYLDIKLLVDIGAKIISNMIKGKSTEELDKEFNITDITPEEKEQIIKENDLIEYI